MTEPAPLHLYEELMLLALRDEEGTLEAHGMPFFYTVAAAFISELLVSQYLAVDPASNKRQLVDLLRSDPTGDPLLDECVAKVGHAKRRASVRTWVSRFAGIKKLKHRVAQQLCRRGILRADEDKVLLVFTRKIYPEINPQPEREVIERLRRAIFTDDTDLDPQTTILVALADKAGVLRNAFDRKDLKRRKDRLRRIADGEAMAKAAQDAVDAAQAAMMVAVIIPTIMTTTVTASS